MKTIIEYETSFQIVRGHMTYVVQLVLNDFYPVGDLLKHLSVKYQLKCVGDIIDFLSRSKVEPILEFKVRVGRFIDGNQLLFNWSDLIEHLF